MTVPTVLMVAEKPSICNSIATALAAKDKMVSRGSSPPVHEFPGEFQNKPCKFKVTSVVGHVYSTDFPQQYQSWGSTDPLELFDAPVKKTVEKGSIVRLLETESRGCSYCVLWLDCDREGENICFEVISLLRLNPPTNNRPQIFRAKFSAINPSDIRKAMQNLVFPNENESKAVDARQELDLKVGVAFSRFQTSYFQGRYAELQGGVVSFGPCQTPTLQFTVKRHVDIVTFKPEPYQLLSLEVVTDGRRCPAVWSRGRCFNPKLSRAFYEVAKASGWAQVVEVKRKPAKRSRPTPLNTVALLKLASKALGMGPYQAMQVAERLYLMGYMSYPRTESTAYPASHDIVGSLREQAKHPHWGAFAAQLVNNGHAKPKKGVDMGDHPPICPCGPVAFPSDLGGSDMIRMYDLVCRHFIATVSPDAEFFDTTITLEVGGTDQEAVPECSEDQGGAAAAAAAAAAVVVKTPGEMFALKGRKLVEPGYLAVLKSFNMRDIDDEDADEFGADAEGNPLAQLEKSVPDLEEGERIPLLGGSALEDLDKARAAASEHVRTFITLKLSDRETSPPDYLSEAELIGAMERHGIGTDASIPTHINNVLKRGYVTLEKNRRLVPTKLGVVLVQGYFRIDADLVLPTVRATIEAQCDLIAKGEADHKAVVKQALNNFKRKYVYFCKNIDRMDELFSSSFSTLESAGKPWTLSGITKRYLALIDGPPARLYDKSIEQVYRLPQGGVYKQWSGHFCEVQGCGFEIMLYAVGSPQRNYPLCPNCFQDPNTLDWGPAWDQVQQPSEVAEAESRNRKCFSCPLPDGHPSVEALTVSDDPDSGGVFILDVNSRPKWKFVSTRSNKCVNLKRDIVKKAIVLNKRDPESGCRIVEVEFHEGKSPREDKAPKHRGCINTDPILSKLLVSHEGQDKLSLKVARAHGMARGRGRRGGRGGRGGKRR